MYPITTSNNECNSTILLDINNTPQLSYPEHLSAEVFIKKLKDKETLSDSVVINGNVSIDLIENIALIFPDTCEITGDFFIQYSGILKLPRVLIVGGNIKISQCHKLEELPTKIEVHGKLNIFRNINLKKFTQELTVGDDLDILLCTQLKEIGGVVNVGANLAFSYSTIEVISANLTVKGHIHLMRISGLTSIEGIWNISKGIFILRCQELQTINVRLRYFNENNFINTANNLKINIHECDELIEILADIVAEKVNIQYCPALNRITGILNITELSISYCIKLKNISADILSVDNQARIEKLSIQECNDLVELSSSIRVISALTIFACDKLVNIPAIIFSLSEPQLFTATFTDIDFSRLSNNLINQNVEYFPNRAAILEILMRALNNGARLENLTNQPSIVPSLTKLIAYWNSSLESQQQLPSLSLDENQQDLLRKFLAKVSNISTGFSYISTRYLAQRIFQLFMVIQQTTDIKQLVFNIIENSLLSCSDSVLNTLTTIELKYMVNDIIKDAKTTRKNTVQELRLLGKRFFYLDKLMNYVANYLNNRIELDEIEVMLFFKIALVEKLNLPLSVRKMCFPNVHGVTFTDIEEAYNYVLTQATEEKINEFLITWEPLEVYIRPQNIIKYADLPFLEVEKQTCIISLSTTDQMVYLNNRCYNYKDLCDWYIQYGKDPIERKAFVWKHVSRIDPVKTTVENS